MYHNRAKKNRRRKGCRKHHQFWIRSAQLKRSLKNTRQRKKTLISNAMRSLSLTTTSFSTRFYPSQSKKKRLTSNSTSWNTSASLTSGRFQMAPILAVISLAALMVSLPTRQSKSNSKSHLTFSMMNLTMTLTTTQCPPAKVCL